jgi:large subunit ribosomal protein L32
VATPKRRKSRSRRNMRRQQHDKVAAPNIVACPNCGEPVVPHRACASCGHYKGRSVKRGTAATE